MWILVIRLISTIVACIPHSNNDDEDMTGTQNQKKIIF